MTVSVESYVQINLLQIFETLERTFVSLPLIQIKSYPNIFIVSAKVGIFVIKDANQLTLRNTNFLIFLYFFIYLSKF